MICTPNVGQTLEVHIFMGRKGVKHHKYSPEFKLSVIMDMRENKLSYRETTRKHLPHLKPDHIDVVQRWERIYLEEGFEGLAKERRGRASKMPGVKKGRPKKQVKIEKGSPNELEQLRERVDYLEAENEYLKKLNALIQEEEAQKAARRRK